MNKITINVLGAPFGIGEEVEVIQRADETFDESFLGKVGRVEYFDYSCGCGQAYPEDPMIGVRFDDKTVEEFWQEELKRKSE